MQCRSVQGQSAIFLQLDTRAQLWAACQGGFGLRHCPALHCTTLSYPTLSYPTQHCTALHCTALHSTEQNCTAWSALILSFCIVSRKGSIINKIVKSHWYLRYESIDNFIPTFIQTTIVFWEFPTHSMGEVAPRMQICQCNFNRQRLRRSR